MRLCVTCVRMCVVCVCVSHVYGRGVVCVCVSHVYGWGGVVCVCVSHVYGRGVVCFCVSHVYGRGGVVCICVSHVYGGVSYASVCHMCDVIQGDGEDLQCDLIAFFTSRTVLVSSNYREGSSSEITTWLQS